MSLLCDYEIVEYAKRGMITPFEYKAITKVKNLLEVEEKVISFGPSSYGYDFRLADRFELFIGVPGQILDPKNPNPAFFKEYKDKEIFVMPPYSYALGHTMEYFSMPENITGVCVGKSTYARCGIIVNVTPAEAGWQGEITVEISNPTPCSVKLYAYEGICQFLFFKSNEYCVQPYNKKNKGNPAKYQGQRGITHSKI